MLIIILLFVFFGKENKVIYITAFFTMIAAAYYISDPHHLPIFIVEHSIIVQTILSKSLFILVCTSRMSQIIEVIKIKSTGSLALTTWALSFLGNIGRITTILVEAAHDYKFLLSMVSVAILNATIVFQFYFYRN
jgi:hypothetical protein